MFSSSEGLNIGAHNAYVQILSDNGLITFMFFLLILGYFGLTSIWKLVKNNDLQFGYSYQVLFSGLAGLVAEGFFHDFNILESCLVIAFLRSDYTLANKSKKNSIGKE